MFSVKHYQGLSNAKEEPYFLERGIMKFIIKGNPATKKNSNRIVKFGARYALIPSKTYKEYESDFIIQCNQLHISKLMINKPVEITCSYYMKTRRKVDLTNLLSATMDCLVKAKIIEDDNCKIAVCRTLINAKL